MSSSIHATAEDSRAAGVAYHLIPIPVWEASKGKSLYEPEAYGADGFIHLTLGTDPLLAVANLFYTSDSRDYSVLILDLGLIQAPVKYEDPDQIYPHIYGLLNLDSVVGELVVSRDPDGTFISIGAA